MPFFEKHISVRYADTIKIGNEVLVYDNEGLSPKKVTNVTNLILKGNKTS